MKDLVSFLQDKSQVKRENVTLEKKLEQLTLELSGLEEENKTLQQILSSSSDPILVTTTEGEITYANPAWEKITGYTFEEVKGKNPRFLKSNKTPALMYRKMWKTILKGKTFTSDEVINKKKNGYEYRIRSHIYPVRKNGNINYFVQQQHDITAVKEREELQKEFLSATAHELKTPITVLKLLTQSHLQKAKNKSYDSIKIGELELVDRELDRITLIINDLLDTSRLETGKQFMTLKRVDISEVVKQTVEKIRIYAKNHEFLVQNFPSQIFVQADPARIEQVLLNLLSNAVKYSPPEREILISGEIAKNQIIISVKDEGMGIPRTKQSLIFDKYYQLKTNSKVGFGLGLYISKEIIKRHKGKIWVTSKVGKGSIFSFSLPLTI